MKPSISPQKFIHPQDLGELQCPLCPNVHLLHLIAIKGCGHLFGKSCLEQNLDTLRNEHEDEEEFKAKCPICRVGFDETLDIHPAPPLAIRLLHKMKLKCEIDECTWEGDVGKYFNHQCDFEIISCPRAKIVCPNGHECVLVEKKIDGDTNYCHLCADEFDLLMNFCLTCDWKVCDKCKPATCSEKVQRKDIELHVLKHERADLRKMMAVSKETCTELYKCRKRDREIVEYEKKTENDSRKRLKLNPPSLEHMKFAIIINNISTDQQNSMYVNSNVTIVELKKEIQKLQKIPIENQCLMSQFTGKILKDGQVVSDCNIQGGSTICLIFCPNYNIDMHHKKFSISVTKNTTVHQLKRKIQDAEEQRGNLFPPITQRLSFGEFRLTDGTMRDYGIKEGDSIYMSDHRIRGDDLPAMMERS